MVMAAAVPRFCPHPEFFVKCWTEKKNLVDTGFLFIIQCLSKTNIKEIGLVLALFGNIFMTFQAY